MDDFTNIYNDFTNIYKNSPNIKSLCLLLHDKLKTNIVIPCWSINDITWFIPAIYLDDYQDNNGTGWYLNKKPDEHNLPYHVHFTTYNVVEFSPNVLMLYNSTNTLDKIQHFIIDVFMEKIIFNDKLNRNKARQKILFSNICHGIRTPLNTLLHASNNVLQDNPNDENTQLINQSSIELANNVFDVIDMAYLQIGYLAIENTLFDIGDLLEQVIQICHLKNKQLDITFDYFVQPIVPKFIYSDKKRLKQILINLIQYSVEHTSDKHIIIICDAIAVNLNEELDTCDNTDDKYELTINIQYTGDKIPNVKNLFHPPEINEENTTLHLSYLLAKKLSGYITAQSNTNTSLNLVVIVREDEPEEKQTMTMKQIQRKNILIVSYENPQKITDLLTDYSVNYKYVSSVEEIDILYSEEKFDKVIMHCSYNHKFDDVVLFANNINEIMERQQDVICLDQDFRHVLFQALSETRNRNISILIVEDEEINRLILEKLLNQLKYNNVTLVSDGQEALNLLHKKTYTIVITDIRMSLMNGFDLASAIHKQIKPMPKIIGITAQMILETDPSHLFDAFVYKPIDKQILHNSIKQVIRCVN